MSYEIIYNKQFVSLPQRGAVIPLLLWGSNNCQERSPSGGWRRARDWSVITHYTDGRLFVEPETLIKRVDADLEREIARRDDKEDTPELVRARFGWYTSLAMSSRSCGELSFDTWRNLFTNGIKGAMTIEQLHEIGVHVVFHTDTYYRQYSIQPPRMPEIVTEENFYHHLEVWQSWREKTTATSKSSGESERAYFSITYEGRGDEVINRLRKHRGRPKREKKIIEVDHYYLLRNRNGYLVKYTRSGYRYTGWSGLGCKHFRTEAEAEKYRRGIVKQGKHQAETWEVKRIEAGHTVRMAV